MLSLQLATCYVFLLNIVTVPENDALTWFSYWSPENRLDYYLVEPQLTVGKKASFGYSEYKGPDTWSLDYPECSGYHQSPININAYNLKKAISRSLQWDGYQVAPQNMTIRNTGETVQVTGQWEETRPRISGGPLLGEYTFQQLHFHWGYHNKEGSEHTVNNQSFPMEIHFVHYKTEYGNFDEAGTHLDGLLVIAVFCQLTSSDDGRIEPIATKLYDIQEPQERAPVEAFPLSQLQVPWNGGYVLYAGSLTTPPCSESVTWMVSTQTVGISHRQLNLFRQLYSEEGPIRENHRPVQPLNGRSVYYVGTFS